MYGKCLPYMGPLVCNMGIFPILTVFFYPLVKNFQNPIFLEKTALGSILIPGRVRKNLQQHYSLPETCLNNPTKLAPTRWDIRYVRMYLVLTKFFS